MSGRVPQINQEMQISGLVLSAEASSPLEGATIRIQGTQKITGTMPDGAFSLVAQPDDTLCVNKEGYRSIKVRITRETYYEISLQADQNK
jgi:hypothetical protein